MRDEKGLSLMELLVVMLSLVLVASMAFQILWESNNTVYRNLSQSSSADRLRILQKTMNQDLASSYPNPLDAKVRIDSTTGEDSGNTILTTNIIEAGAGAEPVLYEVTYSLEEYPEGSGRTAVVRIADPDLSPDRGEEAKVKPVFTLDVEETFDWSVETTDWRGTTSPSKLKLSLTNRRYKDFGTRYEILVHGVENP